jgi:hypothetical protein
MGNSSQSAVPIFGWWYTALGNPNGMFQVRPNNDGVTAPVCNPFVAQAPRRTGIFVALGDGSTRMVSSGVNPGIWWSALTPAGNETLPGDWGQ